MMRYRLCFKGYSSGYCVKRMSKFAAFVIGSLFLTIQTLSYNGYVAVNYDKAKGDLEKLFDLNNDGKVDTEDVKIVYEKVKIKFDTLINSSLL